ncbi:MAG: transporter substrate-binding domain-containing protein [Desulfovibrio sp.]|jgi:ABC-type amino acid transport substrate-binding protein|nr:transporter substrate-binding domain-containing protein [Desulfovibrio sp.]
MRYTEKIHFFIFPAAFALMFCCGRPAGVRAEQALKVGVERSCPPFSYTDEAGGFSGFNIDMARALCVAMERRCEFFALPPDGLLAELREDRLDLVMDVPATSDYAEYMDFSAPYFHARFVYVGRIPPDRTEESGPARIGVCAGSDARRYLEETDALPRNTVVAGEAENIFAALRRGELDAMLVNILQAYAFLVSGADGQFEMIGDPLPLGALSTSHRIGTRKNDRDLGAAVDRALREIRYNGIFLRINRAWFPHTLY